MEAACTLTHPAPGHVHRVVGENSLVVHAALTQAQSLTAADLGLAGAHRLLGMVLCVAGVIGLWGIGFFSPELVGDVIKSSLVKEGVPEAEIAGRQQYWIGVNSIVQNLGAFVGMLLFTRLAQGIGRKAAFAIGYVAALVATVAYFQMFNGRGDIWMSAIMGGCQLALFAGFAIYLPELFPTSLRSTGTSFCYNVGRFLAATGPFTLGALQAALKAGATTPEATRCSTQPGSVRVTPTRMASLASQSVSVATGSAVPCRSMAPPPTSAHSVPIRSPKRFCTASRTLTASRITSGPMPSPANTATFFINAFPCAF